MRERERIEQMFVRRFPRGMKRTRKQESVYVCDGHGGAQLFVPPAKQHARERQCSVNARGVDTYFSARASGYL